MSQNICDYQRYLCEITINANEKKQIIAEHTSNDKQLKQNFQMNFTYSLNKIISMQLIKKINEKAALKKLIDFC